MFIPLPIFISIASIAAGIVLGTGSNWLYDILKARNVLPDKPSLQRVIVLLFFAFGPLIGLAALLDLNKSDETVTEQIRTEQKSNQPNANQLNKGIQTGTLGSNNIVSQYGNVTVNSPEKSNKVPSTSVSGSDDTSRPLVAEVRPPSVTPTPSPPAFPESKPVPNTPSIQHLESSNNCANQVTGSGIVVTCNVGSN